MPAAAPFTREVLALDAAAEADALASRLRAAIGEVLGRRGAVVALSGGVDSSVVAALAVRALGARHVLALLLPEDESADESLSLGRRVADGLGVRAVTEHIGGILAAAGCYRRRDEALRRVLPEFGDGWRFKLVLPTLSAGRGYRAAAVVAETPAGERVERRLPPDAYRTVIAATSFKQRTRAMLAYYHADRLGYALVGTPNRLEYDQGFFVKGGDGAADVKPIAHLYKTQVYELAAHLGLPGEVCRRAPTADTYSLAQTQDEFYFGLPLHLLDLCLCAYDACVPAEEAAPVVGLPAEEVRRVYGDIEQKRRAARYLHLAPVIFADAGGTRRAEARAHR